MTTENKWIPISEDCPRCGGEPEVFTSGTDDYFYEDDKVRCSDCNYRGCITIDDYDDDEDCRASINWDWDNDDDDWEETK